MPGTAATILLPRGKAWKSRHVSSMRTEIFVSFFCQCVSHVPKSRPGTKISINIHLFIEQGTQWLCWSTELINFGGTIPRLLVMWNNKFPYGLFNLFEYDLFLTAESFQLFRWIQTFKKKNQTHVLVQRKQQSLRKILSGDMDKETAMEAQKETHTRTRTHVPTDKQGNGRRWGRKREWEI